MLLIDGYECPVAGPESELYISSNPLPENSVPATQSRRPTYLHLDHRSSINKLLSACVGYALILARLSIYFHRDQVTSVAKIPTSLESGTIGLYSR